MKSVSLFVTLAAVVLTGCASDQKKVETKPAAAATATGTTQSASYVNKRCPVSGEEVSGTTTTVSFQGKNVGFCCDHCLSKWNGMTDSQKAEKVASASK